MSNRTQSLCYSKHAKPPEQTAGRRPKHRTERLYANASSLAKQHITSVAGAGGVARCASVCDVSTPASCSQALIAPLSGRLPPAVNAWCGPAAMGVPSRRHTSPAARPGLSAAAGLLCRMVQVSQALQPGPLTWARHVAALRQRTITLEGRPEKQRLLMQTCERLQRLVHREIRGDAAARHVAHAKLRQLHERLRISSLPLIQRSGACSWRQTS
jgi:hypothetical protein